MFIQNRKDTLLRILADVSNKVEDISNKVDEKVKEIINNIKNSKKYLNLLNEY